METESDILRLLALIVYYWVIGILIAILLGLLYHTFDWLQFQRAHPGEGRTWIGIFHMVMIPFELYLLLICWWVRVLLRQRLGSFWQLLQLIIIFAIGIVPGMFLIFPLVTQ